MPHRITVFTGDCPLCREVVDEIEAGKCSGCQLSVYSVSENLALAREHGVRVVPTVIIDGEVKIEATQTFRSSATTTPMPTSSRSTHY